MDLKNFTKQAILEITEAVNEINIDREVLLVSGKDKRTIEFDVAVTVEENRTATGGGQIQVIGLIRGEGDIKQEVRNATVSRIEFGVSVATATKAEIERQNMEIEAYNNRSFK